MHSGTPPTSRPRAGSDVATARRALQVVAAALVLVLAGCQGPASRDVPELTDTLPPLDAAPPERSAVVGPVTLRVHFTRDEEPVPIERQVASPPATLGEALEQQLAGPTPEEREAHGVTSWFSRETAGMLLSVSVDGEGRAVVDFEDFSGVIPGASSSLGSTVLLGELNATVFQFPTVQTVEYGFQGSCDAFWNWLQYDCQVVEREGAAPIGRAGRVPSGSRPPIAERRPRN